MRLEAELQLTHNPKLTGGAAVRIERLVMARPSKEKEMGNSWEVAAWIDTGSHLRGYDYKTVYSGESLLMAIYHAAKAKRGCGCVKLYWRG